MKGEGQTKMGEKGVGKLSQETPPPREGEAMGAMESLICNVYLSVEAHQIVFADH